MIKLFDDIWYVRRGDEELAYLCHWEDNSGFEKRKKTGVDWATTYRREKDERGYYRTVGDPIVPEGIKAPNTPIQGFKVTKSVSRWSTQNKLIRVSDPRGFECEISTGNLVKLMETCVIANGEVVEECVWGRDGAHNVLLPINSEPYLEAIKNTKESKIPPVKIGEVAVGDLIQFREYGKLTDNYIYLGRGVPVWRCKTELRNRRNYWQHNQDNTKYEVKEEDLVDTRAIHIFLRESSAKGNGPKNMWDFKTLVSPKVANIVGKTEQDVENLRTYRIEETWGIPSRVRKQFKTYDEYYCMTKYSIEDITWKA